MNCAVAPIPETRLNKRQYSLAALLICMTAVGVAVAVLPHPFVAFYCLLVILFGAAVLSRFGSAGTRSFWRWFSCCGWLCVFVGPPLIEMVESTLWWQNTRPWLEQNDLTGFHWSAKKYLMFANASIAFAIALCAGVVVPKLIRLVRSKPMSASPGSRSE